MIGLVLSGGKSLRMGKDKGLILNEQSIPWAKQAFDLLLLGNMNVFVSINSKQRQTYSYFFSQSVLIEDETDLPIEGPLKGLLSAHNQFPNESIFALACDMPNMTIKQISSLIYFSKENPKYDAWAYLNEENKEPLCAIYSISLLNNLITNLSLNFSLTHILSFAKTAYLKVPVSEKICFENINYLKP